jgi:hypothetical protein
LNRQDAKVQEIFFLGVLGALAVKKSKACFTEPSFAGEPPALQMK